MTTPIQVHLVDRKELLLDAFKTLLAQDPEISVVGTATDPQQVDLERSADLFVISANLGPGEGVALVRSLKRRRPAAKVLISGVTREDETLLDFIEAGAVGYVLENEPFVQMVDKLKSLHRNRTICSAQVARLVYRRALNLRHQFAESSADAPFADDIQLTERETEILEWVQCGSSNKEIAARLGISVYTVKNHVHNILEKMQVGRRREAVRLALKNGLIGNGNGNNGNGNGNGHNGNGSNPLGR
ncbi:MAG TPA: response regulator transcription factor [Acidobacteriota bacterium]|nr:response regulator transcription factor [Acidobacteriota bacterium]